MEQLLALPRVVCSLRMPSSHPSSPYSLSLRCVSGALVMMGSGVRGGEWHGAQGAKFPLPFQFRLFGPEAENIGGPKGLPCPENSAYPIFFPIAIEPYCKCGSRLILPRTPTVQRPAGLQAQG